jgi:hypothetical protein
LKNAIIIVVNNLSGLQALLNYKVPLFPFRDRGSIEAYRRFQGIIGA